MDMRVQTKTPARGPGFESKNKQSTRHYRPSPRKEQAYIGIDGLLARLDRVRKTGHNRWMAKSPAREDRTPSLSIRLLDDGRILLHDFGGSEFADIIAALGLEPIQLIPEHLRRRGASAEPQRAPIPCCDALLAITHHANVALIAAHDAAQGKPISAPVLEQLAMAVSVIESALKVAGGAR